MKQNFVLLPSIYALFACILFIPQTLLSQGTFIIGKMGGSNTFTTYPTPYGDSKESMRAQYLYLASELQEQNIEAGNITYVAFLVSDTNGVDFTDNLQIYLSNTPVGSLNSKTWEGQGVLCYDTSGYDPVLGSNNVHILSQPFYWDGISNLLVEVCQGPADPGSGNFASLNASVEFTPLDFNGSHTFAADDYPDVCNTVDQTYIGDSLSRPRIVLRFSCLPPTDFEVSAIGSYSATLGWASPLGGGTANYDLQVGLSGFAPGGSLDSTLVNLDTTGNSVFLPNLPSNTRLDAYIRTDCGNGAVSEWVPLLGFTTLPGCGDFFYDSGGNIFPYDINEHTVTTICPKEATDIVSVDFLAYQIGLGDQLVIYNGPNTNSPILDTLTGGPGPLVSYSATTATGCLTFAFDSDTVIGFNVGWVAKVNCGKPDSCFDVAGLTIFNLMPTKVNIKWEPMFDAAVYTWKLNTQDGGSVYKGDTTATGLVLIDLTPGTNYKFYILTICNSGDSTHWTIVEFYTPLDCNGALNINCGSGTYQAASLGGEGIYELTDCTPIPTIGRESVFRFTAPNTRSYLFEVTSVSNTSVNVIYYYKETSVNACGPDGWECFGSFNNTDTASLGPLIAGHEYYILADPQSTSAYTQRFRINDCKPTNDEPSGAINLALGVACVGNTFSNNLATFNVLPGEPDPSVDGRWLSAADETVWFRFTAPISGSVIISTETVPQGFNFDTQLALYDATNFNDFSTFTLLASDEDNGMVGLGFNSILSYSGLEPGETYLIQVDGYGSVDGNFCIEVSEGINRIEVDECTTAYSVAGVDGTLPGGNRWYPIYTQPDVLDLGDIVAAVKPGLQKLDSVFVKVAIQDTIPVTPWGVEYMPMYYYFTWTHPNINPVTVRLFFHNSEFNDLKVEANDPNATIFDLNASFYEGENADCYYGNNNLATGTVTLNTNLTAQSIGTSGLFYVDLLIPEPGEVGVHLGLVALPITLQSFSGKILASGNLLEWITLAERAVQWHIVERSTDGVHWTEVGRKPGLDHSDTPQKYQIEDQLPTPKAYYRLRSVDYDGSVAVSKNILLVRPETFGIANIFPSPASDAVTVQFVAPAEEDVQIRVVDCLGRLALEQSWAATKGINNAVLPLGGLAAGLYTVTVASGHAVSPPVRMVKK